MQRNLYFLNDKSIYGGILTKYGRVPGVYILKCVDKDNKYISIPRLLNNDDNGTLYIGSSGDVVKRVGSLAKSIFAAVGVENYKDFSSHPLGHKYKNKNIIKKFPYCGLCVEVMPLKTAHEKEATLLKEYEDAFGEAPPFNEGRPKAKHLSG